MSSLAAPSVYIVQYYMHPHQLVELVKRLQHPAVEVCVHMDSCTDDADERAARLAASVSHVSPLRIVHGDNLHELRAYNRVARLARGELVALAQDDTMPPPTTVWIDSVLATFSAMPKLAALGLHRGATRFTYLRPAPRTAPQASGPQRLGYRGRRSSAALATRRARSPCCRGPACRK